MILLLALLGCPEPVEDCVYAAYYLDELTATVPAEPELPAVTFYASSPGSEPLSVYVDWEVANASAGDCVVAVYHSSVEPDPSAVRAVDPSENVPAEHVDGLGELLDVANLAPRNDVLNGYGSVPAGDRHWITVVTCAAGNVEAGVRFEVEYCDNGSVSLREGWDVGTSWQVSGARYRSLRTRTSPAPAP